MVFCSSSIIGNSILPILMTSIEFNSLIGNSNKSKQYTSLNSWHNDFHSLFIINTNEFKSIYLLHLFEMLEIVYLFLTPTYKNNKVRMMCLIETV